MTRVAHVMAGAVHGGAELFFERLCIALHEAGESVLPVIRTNPGRAAHLRQVGMEPEQLSFGGPLDVLTRPRLRRVLHRYSPRVVVTWMNRASRQTPRGDWVQVGRLGAYYNLRHYRQCDHLVANTQGIAAWLAAQGWPTSRVHHLPNFVEDFADVPPAADLVALRRGGRGIVLLALGRLHTDKGFDTLIRALPHLPHAVLAVAGDGPERAALADLAGSEGVADRVHLLGWRNDVGGLLRAADIFVSSSRVEPLGNMVLEAWSASRPVVAVAADGPRELVRDGIDGMLVPHEDPQALAAAIAGVIEDRSLAGRLAETGRSRFAADFTREAALARWRDFLARVGEGR
jgi:glycosyltransferase involved in cell wall biosynthesis